MYEYINIDIELIKEELDRVKKINNLTDFKNFNLHNSLIEKLKNHYNCETFDVIFYDGDPKECEHIDCSSIECENCETNKRFYKSKERISKLIWIDEFYVGSWGINQLQLNKMSIDWIKDTKKCRTPNRNRFYINCKNDYIIIYFYGRDFYEYDCWWFFKRR